MILKPCGDSLRLQKAAKSLGLRVNLRSWEEGSIPWHRCVRLQIGTGKTATSHPIQLPATSAVGLRRLMLHSSAVSSWISTQARRWFMDNYTPPTWEEVAEMERAIEIVRNRQYSQMIDSMRVAYASKKGS